MQIESSLIIPRPDAAPERAGKDRSVSKSVENPGNEAVFRPVLINYSRHDDVHDKASRFQRQAGYDQPQGRGQSVVNTYLSLERETQRASIRQMLGVDLYA